jgi:hypothetical protein
VKFTEEEMKGATKDQLVSLLAAKGVKKENIAKELATYFSGQQDQDFSPM